MNKLHTVIFLRSVTGNREAIEAKKREKQKRKTNPEPWTLKVALRPSGVLLVDDIDHDRANDIEGDDSEHRFIDLQHVLLRCRGQHPVGYCIFMTGRGDHATFHCCIEQVFVAKHDIHRQGRYF